MKFGRRRPTARQRSTTLKLRDYLAPGLPTPPASCDYTPKANAALAQMYGNDTMGDCVIAGFYHVLGVASGNATGTPFLATAAQIIADYSAIGGYVPGDPSTDQGCDEVTALTWWSQNPAADGSKLAGFVELDPTNEAHLQLALWLGCNLYFGIELPDAWVQPMPSASGFTWDVAGAADPSNGHCVMGAGYNSNGVTIGTWAMTGLLTYDAIADYGSSSNGGAVYALITPDWLAQGQRAAPNGVDWDALTADLDALQSSSVMVPPGP